MTNYNNFINWILEKRKVNITYFSQKENRNVIRLCWPFDFWPKRKPKTTNCYDYIDNWENKYLFWDFDWSWWWHIAWKSPSEIINIELLDDKFDPSELIDLDRINCPWHIDRIW